MVAGPTAARSYRWCRRHPAQSYHNPTLHLVRRPLPVYCRPTSASSPKQEEVLAAHMLTRRTTEQGRHRGGIPRFSTFAPYTAAALAPMSLLVPGYLLVTSNQAAIAQKATSFTLNWINMS